jgi:hypothetical protein
MFQKERANMILTNAPDTDQLVNVKEKGRKNGMATDRFRNWLTDAVDHINGFRNTGKLQVILSSTPIKRRSLIERVQSGTAGDVQISGIQISQGLDGQLLKIVGTDDVKTVTLVDGSGVKLTGGNITFSLGTVLDLHYDGLLNLWVENSRN